ncbi:acyl-CoA N-acyltransferase [Chlamydoabsidia padenii]|nr:acyl-CoA N-acyltransferase [Chlamydoabsidia padenii]
MWGRKKKEPLEGEEHFNFSVHLRSDSPQLQSEANTPSPDTYLSPVVDTSTGEEPTQQVTTQRKRAVVRKRQLDHLSSTRVLRQRPPPVPPALATQSFWPTRFPLSSATTSSASLYSDLRPIKQIRLGSYLIDTWYQAPFPEEYSQIQIIYYCEYCLKYMKSGFVWKRHKENCRVTHPPGNEIYRDGPLSVFEVDGRKNKASLNFIYCQNLCLLAKLFLDHKTLFYDVEPFLFYVLTETDHQGCHFVAYFSKEKKSKLGYNLSCIMTLPSHQRNGYGQFLIDFSYLLSKNEQKVGSPEKPLSDLGLLSYRKYWSHILQEYFSNHSHSTTTTIEEISRETSMTLDDIINTLEEQDMLKRDEDGQFELLTTGNESGNSIKLRAKQDLLTWVPY